MTTTDELLKKWEEDNAAISKFLNPYEDFDKKFKLWHAERGLHSHSIEVICRDFFTTGYLSGAKSRDAVVREKIKEIIDFINPMYSAEAIDMLEQLLTDLES
jgi:hypothetical protein